jgi:diacylglycerol kinase family enzyme
VLGICGGDGTVHHTLTRFYHVYGEKPLPKVATLGGGTMNMLMHSIKVLGPSEGIAHRLKAALEKPGSLQTVRRDTLLVEGKVGVIFGIGLVSNFLNAYYEGGNTGPLKAALVLQRGVYSVIRRTEYVNRLFAPARAKVSVDGKPVPYEAYTALLVQTIENLGIGFAPMYRAFEKPGHFHVIGSQMTPVRLVNHLPEIFFGRPMHHPDTFDEVARELVVSPETEVTYTVDGDMYSSTKDVHVSVGPTIDFLKV